MAEVKKTKPCGGAAAFTMIEIIITMVILAIAAVIAVPMMSGAADMQVRSAANRLAADLDYAKNMAITHQRSFTVVFDKSATVANGYKIQRRDAASTLATILNPVSQRDFDVRFNAERSLSRVQIITVALTPTGTPDAITFDYLGTPYCGDTIDAANRLISGCITLAADGAGLKVVVEPMTGYITITP